MLLVDNVGFARSVRIVLHKAICYQVRYSGFAIIVDGF